MGTLRTKKNKPINERAVKINPKTRLMRKGGRGRRTGVATRRVGLWANFAEVESKGHLSHEANAANFGGAEAFFE